MDVQHIDVQCMRFPDTNACLYLLSNDLHMEPFALVENSGNTGDENLVDTLSSMASALRCYKIIATSGHSGNLISVYSSAGFARHGLEFILPLGDRWEAVEPQGMRFLLRKKKQEVGHAYLYLLTSSQEQTFGFLEDIQVEKNFQGEGHGTKLLNAVINAARGRCCSLMCTSRHNRPFVHRWYERCGFSRTGLEYRKECA